MSWDHDSYTVRRCDGLMGPSVLAGHGDYVIIGDYCHYCGHPQRQQRPRAMAKKKTELETDRQMQRRREESAGGSCRQKPNNISHSDVNKIE